jgi:SAM-dependent methyltransferase
VTAPTQSEIWNGVTGDAWARHRDDYDTTLVGFGRAVMDRLPLRSGANVLDIGCGTGQATVELAQRVEPGSVTGVDISQPMLDAARRRAAEAAVGNVSFEQLNAETEPLGEARFDIAFSRVGVMFFSEPVVAFTNIRRSLVEGGRLGFVCFQEPDRNPLITVPARAAMGALGLEPPAPGGPGPFALADPELIRRILRDAGFIDVSVEPGPDSAVLNAHDGVDALAHRVIEQTPMTGPALASASPEAASAAVAAVAGVLEEHRHGDEVRFGAATWIVLATPGAA